MKKRLLLQNTHIKARVQNPYPIKIIAELS